MNPHRREVLLVLASALAMSWGCNPPPAVAQELRDWLPPEAAAVGRAYLAAYPENDETLLMALIGSVESASENAKDTLAEQIRNELREGDLIDVEGWRLGRTECRLAAILWRAS